MRLRTCLTLLALAVALFVTTAASAAPYYYLTDLGDINGANYTQAEGINNNGDVVGRAKSAASNSYYEAFLYTSGEMYSIGYFDKAPLSSNVSYGYAINDSGQIAGYSKTYKSDKTHAFRYEGWTVDGTGNLVGGVMNDLGQLTIVEGGVTKTSTYTQGIGINEAGHAVGFGSIGYTRGWYTSGPGDAMVPIGSFGDTPTSAAHDINNSGQITGYSHAYVEGQNRSHAFIKNPGDDMQDLGTLGGLSGTCGFAINDNSQVAGKSTLATEDGGYTQAFLWSESTGMIPIGTLGTGTTSEASGINDNGDVVGKSTTVGGSTTRAFLYTDGDIYNLDNRIDPSLGWTLSKATDINENGQICGYGSNGTSSKASFILTEALPGDADLDGTVDLADLTQLLTFYNQSVTDDVNGWMKGDFDGNSEVELADLTNLLTFYNQGVLDPMAVELLSAHGFTVTVPEPSTIVMLILALAGLLAYARGKRS